MKHKEKNKHESDSSEDSSSSGESSSSSDSDRNEQSKKRISNRDEYEKSTKRKKKYSESDSDNERYKTKSVKSTVITKHLDKSKSHSSHYNRKKETKIEHRDKYDEEKESDDLKKEKYEDKHNTDRRRHYHRDRQRNQEHNENRSSYHHRRREREPEENSRSRDDRDRNLDDKRRERPWNRRQRSKSRSFDHANANWGKHNSDSKSDKKTKEKEKPNFQLSGKLTEETNMYKGVVIKYSEPPEARKPRRRWRLYPFKGEKSLQTLYIHRQSAYLIGRDRKIADLPVDHPSCSKQHAALQYRLVQFTREDGSVGKRVRPYIIDLESANGTFVNNKKIDPKKFVELLERDVIKFGFSSREYVLLHENSKDEALDDDVKLEDEESELKIKKEEP